MLIKNKEKEERKKRRLLWSGYYQRKTKTKKGKLIAMEKKHKNRIDD